MADDTTDTVAPTIEASFAADPETLLGWAEDGGAVLSSILDESHAPDLNRVMRTYTQAEILGLVGEKHQKTLRSWVHEFVVPRHSKASQQNRIRLTVDELYEFMADHDLLPTRPRDSKPFRIMVGAYKGGSSKSTLTLHLAHYLASKMWRVLVIDTDSQATLTKAFGWMPDHIDDDETLRPVFEAITDKKPVPALRHRKTHLPTVRLTPSNRRVMESDIDLALAFRNDAGSDFYTALGHSLSLIEDEFDIILIDTPPAFSLTSVATVWASNALIMPMPAAVPDFAATFDFCEMVGGLAKILESMSGTRKVWEPALVIHSKVESNSTADTVRSLAGEVFRGQRIEEFIPLTAAVSNSFGEFKSVYEMTGTTVDSRSLARAREAYNAVGSRVERILIGVWERQALEARE